MAETVLVTGARGFIGSHLCDALVARGERVRALVRYDGRGGLGHLEALAPATRRAIDVVRGDITDPYFVRAAVEGCAAVFHLAALIAIPYSYAAPRNVFDVNVMGTLHVAQACVATDAALVHTSTSEVYGSAQRVPIDEGHPLVGQSPYAASKIGADQCVGSFVRAFGLRAITVRPFNTYGPRQSARAIVPTIMTQAISDAGVVRLGTLDTTRDLLFVEDTVRGFVAARDAIDRAKGEVVNLGTGVEVTIRALAERIFALAGVAPRIESDTARVRPAASEVERLCADATRARALLGWTATVALDEGLAKTLEYVRAHLADYRPGEYLT
jgi:NAD dependent epimerase/dehydratase